MKTNLVLYFMVFGLLLLVNSCTTFQISGLQMGLDNQQESYQVLGDFRTKVYIIKFFGQSGGATLFNLLSKDTDKEINEAIHREIQKRGGTAAINISIDYGASVPDLFWNGFFYLLASSTATVTGTVIKER